MKIFNVLSTVILSTMLISPTFADDDDNRNANCPIGLIAGKTIEEEFGPGAAAVTRCLKKTNNVKVAYNVLRDCRGSAGSACMAGSGKPYAIGNIRNAISDYNITHGMDRDDSDIVAIVYGNGANLILKNNLFEADIEGLLESGVKIYFCQNTARAKGIKLEDMIDGVEFITSGVTALADFQRLGYSVVTPNH